MSMNTIEQALERIRCAPRDSMIAVFKITDGFDKVNVVFHNTLLTRSLLDSDGYIGSYHKDMDTGVIVDEIYEAITA
jgi:hypothetical protein